MIKFDIILNVLFSWTRDKRKKLVEEVGVKAVEAESHYRTCVEESNARHRNLLAVKSQVCKM